MTFDARQSPSRGRRQFLRRMGLATAGALPSRWVARACALTIHPSTASWSQLLGVHCMVALVVSCCPI